MGAILIFIGACVILICQFSKRWSLWLVVLWWLSINMKSNRPCPILAWTWSSWKPRRTGRMLPTMMLLIKVWFRMSFHIPFHLLLWAVPRFHSIVPSPLRFRQLLSHFCVRLSLPLQLLPLDFLFLLLPCWPLRYLFPLQRFYLFSTGSWRLLLLLFSKRTWQVAITTHCRVFGTTRRPLHLLLLLVAMRLVVPGCLALRWFVLLIVVWAFIWWYHCTIINNVYYWLDFQEKLINYRLKFY